MEILLGLDLTTCLLASAVIIIAALYYWYNSEVNHYWKARNVKSDRPVSAFQHFRNVIVKEKPLFLLDAEQYKKYGRACGTYFASAPGVMLSDPDLLRQVLVKDFHVFTNRKSFPTSENITDKMMHILQDEEWKRVRSIVSPVFTSGKLRKLALLVNKCVDSMSERFMELADKKEPVEIKKCYSAFSLDIIASTAFGTELDSIRNPDNIFATNVRKLSGADFSWKFLLFMLAPKLAAKLKIGLTDAEAVNFFSDLVMKIREQRLNGNVVREDLLQMLMDIESATAANEKDDQDQADSYFGAPGGDQQQITPKYSFKKTLSKDELLAQCVLFFFAGHDTTSTTLALTCYLLALNTKHQDRLIEEVDQTWEKHGQIDYDVVHSMKFLDAVVAETLRMYPPAYRLSRECSEDYVLGDTGIKMTQGMLLLVPTYAIHHDPEFFPEPETFNPDRFMPENKDSIRPYTYMPFGFGPRNCVAMRFALMEVKLCLAHVLRHVTFRPCDKTEVPLEFCNGGQILPKSVTVQVERRH